jgi:hypothetical protein
MMNLEQALKRIQELEAKQVSSVKLGMSDAGYVELFGLPGKGRFSISNTVDGWTTLFSMEDQIKKYCEANAVTLKAKQELYRAKKQAAVG